ncbi:MAG: lysoplasmalogenase [Xanthomonadales bacterium]|nr:lysoplasmalogenase [Xanthomonadales bacterium]
MGLALALAGEYRSNFTLSGLGKLVAASSYIAAALSLDALGTEYGRLVLVAMAFCWVGDLLLVSVNNRLLFLAGLVSFLLGHFVYIGAFAVRGISVPALALSAAVLAVFAWRVLAWLKPVLDQKMRRPVWLYVVTISAMMATAVGTFSARGGMTVLLGGLLFLVSDLTVARNRFVAPGFVNRIWGLPMYFAAQLLFAASVAAV